jgi:hypothetical protein
MITLIGLILAAIILAAIGFPMFIMGSTLKVERAGFMLAGIATLLLAISIAVICIRYLP